MGVAYFVMESERSGEGSGLGVLSATPFSSEALRDICTLLHNTHTHTFDSVLSRGQRERERERERQLTQLLCPVCGCCSSQGGAHGRSPFSEQL